MGNDGLKDLMPYYCFAAKQMANGVRSADIEGMLVEQGLGAGAAHKMVSNMQQDRLAPLKKAGQKNMLYGALWCVGGIVVTALTYGAAAGAGRGRYIVAWGAILFGGIQFVRGLIQSARE
jgi:hypothetical protein